MKREKGQLRDSTVVLGIDLGTTALKAVLSDGVDRIIASASAGYATLRPHPGWSEQDPEVWWAALVKVARQLRLARPKEWRGLSAISFSGQMHGVTLVAGGRVLRTCLLHNDGRAVAEACDLNSNWELGDIAGVRAMAGFAAPKLLWLARNEPDTLANADWILSPKDYLRFQLTGEAATDPVDASGFWLMDIAKGQWSSALADASQVPLEKLPPIKSAHDVAGPLQRDAAKALGLPTGIPVMTGTGDAAANTLGLGLVDDGDGIISLGTAAQIFVTRNSHQPYPAQNIHAFAYALPGKFFQMAAMLNGASPLAWLAERLNVKDITGLLRQAEKRVSPSPLLFLPYLSGERTPHDDPGLRAAFLGLSAEHDEVDLARAVLEGVALSLADSYDVMLKAGSAPKHLFAIGGGFRSRFWAKLVASALGRPISIVEASEYGGALGAARLARAGLGDVPHDQIFKKPDRASVIQPDPQMANTLQARLLVFRQALQALQPIR